MMRHANLLRALPSNDPSLPLNFEKILDNITVIENIVDITFLSRNGSIYPIADESP